jgi:hypothetical protein
MDLIRLYYYTSIPIITCNMLFYSITILSTSITSSQNVIKFVTENKTCDSIKFKNELETLDIFHKLQIIESLIFDILTKYCNTKEEFDDIKYNILNPTMLTKELIEDDFIMVDVNVRNININISDKYNFLNKINEPLKYALFSTIEVVQNINNIITQIYDKIIAHNNSYLKNIITLCLQNDIKILTKYANLLDKRLHLLFKLIKIYVKN